MKLRQAAKAINLRWVAQLQKYRVNIAGGPVLRTAVDFQKFVLQFPA
jgi:hypothetical protein